MKVCDAEVEVEIYFSEVSEPEETIVLKIQL